jgi:glycosyltransferase involved in cell wall biosynthesis
LPLRLASIVTVISEQTKTEVLKTGAVPEAKIRVIPNFVDPALTFSERPFLSAQPRILHVGTTPNKNLCNVIAALRGTPCLLVIVGPLPEALRKSLQDTGVRHENVVGIDHAAMIRLYQDADIISVKDSSRSSAMVSCGLA